MILLIYIHVVFSQKPVTCLSHLHDIWPRQGVLRVELFFETPPEDYNLEQSYAKEYQNNYNDDNDENSFLKNLPIAEISIESSEKSYPNMSINSSLISSIEPPPDDSLNKILNDNPIIDQSEENDDDESLFNFDWLKYILIEEQHIFEYSLEYGFLRLPPETRKRLNIEVLLVTLGKKFFFYIKIFYFIFFK